MRSPDGFPPDYRPCPVDGCTQPHRTELADIYNRSFAIPIPPPESRHFPELAAVHRDAINAAMNARAAEQTALASEVHERHAHTHTPTEYLATIHRLERDLGNINCGIRPHAYPRPPAADPNDWPAPTLVTRPNT